MRKTRSRAWQDPASEARIFAHSASYPRAERSPRTAPSARKGRTSASPRHVSQGSTSLWAFALVIPLTFSITTRDGRILPITYSNHDHSPDLLPGIMPARWPAQETSWHGNPPAMMSTASPGSSQSARVMSPRLGTPGYRAASSLHTAGSLSATQASSAPVIVMTAWSSPPKPVNSDPRLRVIPDRGRGTRRAGPPGRTP